MAFIATPYRWYYDNSLCGEVQTSPRIQKVPLGTNIVGDSTGLAAVSPLFQGTNAFIDLVFLEWDAPGVQKILSIWAGEANHPGAVGPVGCSGDAAIGANPALNSSRLKGEAIGECAPEGEDWWWADEAFPVFGTPMEWNLGSDLRQVAVRFQLYPYIPFTNAPAIHWQTGNSNPG